jgi:predicted nucleic acid-binding protein
MVRCIDDRRLLFLSTYPAGIPATRIEPSVFKKDALTLADAWQKLDLFLIDPRISFANEPADAEQHWRSFTERHSFSPHVWNDAYLAAFARCGNLELVTFDQGLLQYSQVSCTVLR